MRAIISRTPLINYINYHWLYDSHKQWFSAKFRDDSFKISAELNCLLQCPLEYDFF